MKRFLFKELALASLIFAAIAALFYFAPFHPKAPTLELSVDQEERLGRVIVDHLPESNTERLNTPEWKEASQELKRRLGQAVGTTPYNYHFILMDSDEINAFTLPGGYVIVNRGLVEFVKDPSELAAVIAHELGHVEKRHIVTKLVKELGVTLLFSVLTGGDASILKEISRSAMSTLFDRRQEQEADQFAFKVMVQAQLNPHLLADFFGRLSDEYGDHDEVPTWLTTHPNHQSRIKSALEYVLPADFKAVPLKFNLVKLQESFDLQNQANNKINHKSKNKRKSSKKLLNFFVQINS